MKFNKENIYFLKPIEVNNSYSGFNKTWNRIKTVYENAEGLIEAALLKSHNEKNKIGYISYSCWKNKNFLTNAVSENIILKYHKTGLNEKFNINKDLYKFNSEIIKETSAETSSNVAICVTFYKNETGNQDLSKSLCIKHINKLMKTDYINQVAILKSLKSDNEYMYVSLAGIRKDKLTSTTKNLNGFKKISKSVYKVSSKLKTNNYKLKSNN